jgi:hypothetical protein
MEHTRSSEFPQYEDGDVAIIVTPLKTYQLHSGILRRYSHYFAEILAEEQAVNLTNKAKKDGVTTRYRLQLVKTQFGSIGTFQRLVSAQRPPLSNSHALTFRFSSSITLVAHLQAASH